MLAMVVLVVLFLLLPQKEQPQIILPENPTFTTHEQVTTITYKEPYEAFVQYFPSEESITTDTEHLLMLLTENWGNEEIDFSLTRGMDTIGGEHLAIARVINNQYEIRAYQNIGQDYFAYVTVTCEITEFSLDEIYAGIENTIRVYEKNNREIQLS